MLAQCVGLGRGGRILVGARQRDRLCQCGFRRPAEPVVAHAPDHAAAVGGETRLVFGVGGAAELGQAAADLAQENVAVADEHRAPVLAIEIRAGGIEVGEHRAFDAGRGTARDRQAPGVAHRRIGALERVVRALAIERPPRRFHRRPDPVRMRHRLVQRERRIGRTDRRRRGSGQGKGKQGRGEQCIAHGGSEGTGKVGKPNKGPAAGARAAFPMRRLRRQSGESLGEPMQAYVYKSLRKPDTYVYLRKRDDFAVVPEPVRLPLGELVFVLEVALTPDRKLAQVDPAVVRANLVAQGFHLQFPPTLLDPMVDG